MDKNFLDNFEVIMETDGRKETQKALDRLREFYKIRPIFATRVPEVVNNGKVVIPESWLIWRETDKSFLRKGGERLRS